MAIRRLTQARIEMGSCGLLSRSNCPGRDVAWKGRRSREDDGKGQIKEPDVLHFSESGVSAGTRVQNSHRSQISGSSLISKPSRLRPH